jgi:hypothetical protein
VISSSYISFKFLLNFITFVEYLARIVVYDTTITSGVVLIIGMVVVMMNSLVEKIAKKNRSRFPIGVLWTTLICSC